MLISQPIRFLLALLFAGTFLSNAEFARAQDEGEYDPQYDEEAAGTFEYSDAESAGEVYDEPLTSSAPAAEEQPPPEAEPPIEAEASVSTEGEGSFSWDTEKPAPIEGPPSERDKMEVWEWGAPRHHINLRGTTGLFHIYEAGSDEAGTFAIGVHGAWFKYTDYLYPGDENTFMWGGVHLRITPFKFLEIYGAIQSRANYNNMVHPELFQALGDLELGLKGYYSPSDWFTFGGLVIVSFMNPVGEVAMGGEGTSVTLGLASSFDFNALNESVPLRAHINAGYHFDNSAKLVDGIEETRGGCGTDVDGDGHVDYDGCLNAVERTALGIDRNDQFVIGVGVDAPFPYITGIVEWEIEIPVNRQDYTCPQAIPGNPDSCMDLEGAAAMRQWLSLGVRVLPPIDSLAIDLGVDIGLSGYAPTVHELAAQAPYRILFGLSYNFDPFPEEKMVPMPAPLPVLPPEPRPEPQLPVIVGLVHDAESVDTPVPDATIKYLGTAFNSQLSSTDGRFRSYPLDPGTITLAVAAEGYRDATFTVDIPYPSLAQSIDYSESTPSGDLGEPLPAGDNSTNAEDPNASMGSLRTLDTADPFDASGPIEISLNCPLTALPKKGTLAITVVNAESGPLHSVAIKLEGPSSDVLSTGVDGKASLEVDGGSYTLKLKKDGFFAKATTIDVKLNTTTEIEIQLSKKPKKSSVIVQKRRIVIKKRIHFETDSDVIKSNSFALMDEITDILLTHKELKLIEIQGHTDNRGKAAYNLSLSARRAQSVRRYLLDSGVEASRVDAKGFGSKRPKAPNITSQGRSRNRRVEFHIIERD
jgi:outer membrane protein OmpA-like peptidoglycan-associated protein